MNIIKKSILAGVIAFTSISASAEFISTDLDNNSDSLATLHVETGIEWLDLSETKGLVYDTFVSGGYTELDGWRVATQSELSVMMDSFFGNYSGGVTNKGVAANNLWKSTFGISGTDWVSAGWYEQDNGLVNTAGLHANNDMYGTDWVHSPHDPFRAIGYANVGLWLVSDGGTTLSSINNPSININNINSPINSTVPLPATAFLLGLSGLLFIRKNKVSKL